MRGFFKQSQSSLLLVAVNLLVLAGCGGGGGSERPPDVQVVAPDQISESFSVYRDSPSSTPRLAIRKTSLNREFLLQGSLALQLPIPQGHALRSRIVVFVPEGRQLHMLAAPEGYVVSGQIPAELLLTSFDIVNESSEMIQFDWNSGMGRVFNASDWYSHDSSGLKDVLPFRMIHISQSRVSSAQITNDNQIVIRQSGSVEQTAYGVEYLLMAEMKYYLAPYRPNPGYEPVAARGFSRMGFFESYPRYGVDGNSLLYASRFDIRKPIVFAVSANTPPLFRQAVKDGALYWNRALPAPVISVIDAPEGVTAPDIHYNMIQWVPWDQSESAYADAQLDPRTGEILHAQIYLTSTFALEGRSKVRSALRQMNAPKKAAAHGHGAMANLSFPSLCHFEPEEAFRASFTGLLAAAIPDAQILQASQDFIRSVAGHEVGHTLGFRHNFAASLSTENYPLAQAPALFAKYLQTGSVDESVKTASSLMDYSAFEEGVLIGARIRLGYPALKYDVVASGALYAGQKFKKGDIPLFCTDSQVGDFIDCNRFDAGSSIVEFAKWNTQKKLGNLASDVYEKYASARTSVHEDSARLVESVPVDLEKMTTDMLSPVSAVLSHFAGTKRILSVYARRNYVGPMNLEEVKKEENAFLVAEMNQIGGIEQILGILPGNLAQNLPEKFEALVAGKLRENGVSDFSPEELDAIRETVKAMGVKLPEALAKGDLESLKKIPANWKRRDGEWGDPLVRVITKRFDEYVLRTGTEAITEEIEIPRYPAEEKPKEGEAPMVRLRVSLPRFFYSADVRKGAAALLAPAEVSEDSDDSNPEWALAERAEYKARLLALAEGAFGCVDGVRCRFEKIEPKSVKLVAAPEASVSEVNQRRKQVTRWLLENQQILEKLK